MITDDYSISNVYFTFDDSASKVSHRITVRNLVLQLEVNKIPRLTLSYANHELLPLQGAAINLFLTKDVDVIGGRSSVLKSSWFLISSSYDFSAQIYTSHFSVHFGAFSRLTGFGINNINIKDILDPYFTTGFLFDISPNIPAIETFVSFSDTLEILLQRLARYTNSFFLFLPISSPDILPESSWLIRWRPDIESLRSVDRYFPLPVGVNSDLPSSQAYKPLKSYRLLFEDNITHANAPSFYSSNLFKDIPYAFSQTIHNTVGLTNSDFGSSDIYHPFSNSSADTYPPAFDGIVAHLIDDDYFPFIFDFSFFVDFSSFFNSNNQLYFPVSTLVIYTSRTNPRGLIDDLNNFFSLDSVIGNSQSTFNIFSHNVPISHLHISESSFRRAMVRFKSNSALELSLKSLNLLFDDESQLPFPIDKIKYPVCHAVVCRHPDSNSLGPLLLSESGFYKTRICIKLIGINLSFEVDWAIPFASFDASSHGGGSGGDLVLVPEVGTLGFVLFLGFDGNPIFFASTHYPNTSTSVKPNYSDSIHGLTAHYGFSLISSYASVNIEAKERLFIKADRFINDNSIN